MRRTLLRGGQGNGTAAAPSATPPLNEDAIQQYAHAVDVTLLLGVKRTSVLQVSGGSAFAFQYDTLESFMNSLGFSVRSLLQHPDEVPSLAIEDGPVT